MKRENIEAALGLSSRLQAIDGQLEKLTNVQAGTGLRIAWRYQSSGSDLACTDLSREEALAMMQALRELVTSHLREMGVTDAT